MVRPAESMVGPAESMAGPAERLAGSVESMAWNKPVSRQGEGWIGGAHPRTLAAAARPWAVLRDRARDAAARLVGVDADRAVDVVLDLAPDQLAALLGDPTAG